MFFSKSLTIPENTPILSPARMVLKVSRGVVRHVWVRWRWGSANLAGVRMRYQEYQFWPATGSEWYPSTEHPLDFADDIPIVAGPVELAIEGYNLDDTYPHTVWVAFNVLRLRITPNMAQFLRDLEGVG